jgi:hypothetical protein
MSLSAQCEYDMYKRATREKRATLYAKAVRLARRALRQPCSLPTLLVPLPVQRLAPWLRARTPLRSCRSCLNCSKLLKS